MPFVWIGVLIACLVVEAITVDLVAIWFFPAALIAMILAFFPVPVYVQVLIFVLVGLVLLLSTRRACVRFLKSRGSRTNVDAAIGERVLVTEEINNLAQRGEVKLNGLRWSARAEDEKRVIPVGEEVEVVAVSGVKLIVR